MTGKIRRFSSVSETSGACGRVLCPPISMIVAPFWMSVSMVFDNTSW